MIACVPTLYEGSVIERHEGFISPFLAGFLLPEPIRVVSCCFSARVGLVFIAQYKLKFRTFTERSHTYVRTSTATAYTLTEISFGYGIIHTEKY